MISRGKISGGLVGLSVTYALQVKRTSNYTNDSLNIHLESVSGIIYKEGVKSFFTLRGIFIEGVAVFLINTT